MNTDHLINIARNQNIDRHRRMTDCTMTAAERARMHYDRQASRLKESREDCQGTSKKKEEGSQWMETIETY